MKYILKFLFHLLPVILFFIFETITVGEIKTTLFLIIISIIYFYLTGFKKREISFMILGIIIGFLVEVIMGTFARQQFWNNASLFGVPIWLPLVWGLGFVIIRRLGDIIVLHRKGI